MIIIYPSAVSVLIIPLQVLTPQILPINIYLSLVLGVFVCWVQCQKSHILLTQLNIYQLTLLKRKIL